MGQLRSLSVGATALRVASFTLGAAATLVIQLTILEDAAANRAVVWAVMAIGAVIGLAALAGRVSRPLLLAPQALALAGLGALSVYFVWLLPLVLGGGD